MGITSTGRTKIRKALKDHAMESAVFIAGRAINEILNGTPAEEPGRMQAAWISAFRKLGAFAKGGNHKKALSHIESLHIKEAADEDDKSWGYGSAEVGGGKSMILITLRNMLDFASTVEYGGVIHVGVGGNTGPKRAKIFPGQLDGPRRSKGTGYLRWVDESGKTHIERQRAMSGSNSIKKSLSKAKKVARRFGFK